MKDFWKVKGHGHQLSPTSSKQSTTLPTVSCQPSGAHCVLSSRVLKQCSLEPLNFSQFLEQQQEISSLTEFQTFRWTCLQTRLSLSKSVVHNTCEGDVLASIPRGAQFSIPILKSILKRVHLFQPESVVELYNMCY